MSQHRQPGPPIAPEPHEHLSLHSGADSHVDADQLGAFAEGALPEHERALLLRHLAGCADCRELAFLAQSAEPEFAAQPAFAAAPAAAPSRLRPGLGWLWTVALAGCVLAVLMSQVRSGRVFMGNKPVANVPQAHEEARMNPVPGPPNDLSTRKRDALATSSRAPASRAYAAGVKTKRLPSRRATSSEEPAVTAGSVRDLAADAAAVVTARQRQMTFTRRTAPPLAQEEVHGQMQAATNAAPSASSVNGSVLDYLAPQPARTAAPQSAMTPSAPPPAPGGGAAAANGAVDSASQTIEVSAANLEVDSVNASPQPIQLAPGKAARVEVSRGKVHLAVDQAGVLFRSTHATGHWHRLKPAWTGAVMSLDLTEAGLFHVTPSGGAAYVSSDGKHWTAVPRL